MLTNSSSIQTLLAQFQTRYPTGCLTSELLTIHQENYVVRAVVQVGGMVLATGMAAATDIEQAEDRAKLRVLLALGVGAFSPPISSQGLSPAFSAVPTSAKPSAMSSSAGLTPSSEFSTSPDSLSHSSSSVPSGFTPNPTTPEIQSELPEDSNPLDFAQSTLASLNRLSNLPQTESLAENEQTEADRAESDEPLFQTETTLEESAGRLVRDHPSLEQAQIPESQSTSPQSTTKSATSGKSKSIKSKAGSPEPTSTEKNDRSEEIARIGVEMKRLNWTTEQGRNYLKRTYGKRSRQELSDEELLDFLRYLETQPSPSESPF